MGVDRSKKFAVVGVGNLLLSDDGIGIHVLNRLRESPVEGVELIEAGTSVLHAADCLQGFDHIVVVDAVEAGHKPGTIYIMSGDAVLENDYSMSVHSLGLKTALKFAASEEDIVWTVVGVEPETLEYGMQLSGPVEHAVSEAMQTIENLIKGWRS